MAERLDVVGHFTFEAHMGYVILMKTLRGTIATIYPSTHPRYVYGVGYERM